MVFDSSGPFEATTLTLIHRTVDPSACIVFSTRSKIWCCIQLASSAFLCNTYWLQFMAADWMLILFVLEALILGLWHGVWRNVIALLGVHQNALYKSGRTDLYERWAQNKTHRTARTQWVTIWTEDRNEDIDPNWLCARLLISVGQCRGPGGADTFALLRGEFW